MCGIYGLAVNKNFHEKYPSKILEITNNLFLFSQTRGSEAAGSDK